MGKGLVFIHISPREKFFSHEPNIKKFTAYLSVNCTKIRSGGHFCCDRHYLYDDIASTDCPS